MPVRAVAFDIGGVLEGSTDTGLEGRWEQRLGLRSGEFFQRLRQSGLGSDANLGRGLGGRVRSGVAPAVRAGSADH
jgi:hypothetical protein